MTSTGSGRRRRARRGWRVLGVLAAALVLLLATVAIMHRLALGRERSLLDASPVLVEAGDSRLHVVTYGQCASGAAVVFLSGGGTPAPAIDFAPVAEQVAADQCAVIVERAGYGYSPDSDAPRDLDTVLDESRAALAAIGIGGPLVLAPHSMSGLEALRWAQRFPDEVAGIVGLDMATPAAYDALELPPPAMLEFMAGLREIGILRVLGAAGTSEPATAGHLSEPRREEFLALAQRGTLTAPMRAEIAAVPANSALVAEHGVPEVPLLLLVSNGQGTGLAPAEWIALQHGFAASTNAEVVDLSMGHYVHSHAPDEVAAAIRDFPAGPAARVPPP